MMFITGLLVLVACVARSSSLRCFYCHRNHGHGNKLECNPQLCTQGQVCGIQGSTHHDPRMPSGCQYESNCHGNTCCRDDDCVENVMTAAHLPFAPRPTTTLYVPSTTTPSPFICHDEVVSFMNDCKELASDGACHGHLGVHVCQKTCGFCNYVKSTFGEEGYCKDTLIHNECSTLSNANMCADALAIHICPVTCGLCEMKLQNVIGDFLNRTTTTTVTTTTTTPPTTSTTSTTTTPCLDEVVDNGCASLPNVCQEDIGHTVCRKFCNLCATPTMPNGAETETTTTTTTEKTAPTTIHSKTNFPTTKVTQLETTPTNSPQCVDQLKNDGCALLPSHICQENIAHMTCPKFCNLC